MISIIPEYCNRNLLVKWINSHQHHTCIYMGTVLLPFLYIIEQSKAPNSVSQSSPTHVFPLVLICQTSWISWGSPFSNTYPMTCTRVHLSTYGNIVRNLGYAKEKWNNGSTGSEEESCTVPSNTSYRDSDWDELASEIQKAARVLGYSKNMWNADQVPPSANKYWDELTSAEQKAAKKLGFNTRS